MIQLTDLLAVNRAGVDYQVTVNDLKEFVDSKPERWKMEPGVWTSWNFFEEYDYYDPNFIRLDIWDGDKWDEINKDDYGVGKVFAYSPIDPDSGEEHPDGWPYTFTVLRRTSNGSLQEFDIEPNDRTLEQFNNAHVRPDTNYFQGKNECWLWLATPEDMP